MTLQVVGAGPPRTATDSLRSAFVTLLGAPVHHLCDLPGHPYVLGPQWSAALSGATPDWDALYDRCVGGFDWPTSLFWRELAAHAPEALVVLSTRDSTDTWLDSMEATVLPVARAVAPLDWIGGRDLAVMVERFVGTPDWDDRAVLGDAYEQWVADVRADADPARFVDWQVGDGWEPLCAALGVPVPDVDFPWTNRRDDWLY